MFLLQNRGHGFSLDPGHANALAPGKRPYHTIIPGLATNPAGGLHTCFGVMGGFMQPQGHVHVLLAMLIDGLDPQAALDRPRLCIGPDGDVAIEQESEDDHHAAAAAAALAAMGHNTRLVGGHGRALFGRGQIISRDTRTGVLCGGSDLRGDGCALGLCSGPVMQRWYSRAMSGGNQDRIETISRFMHTFFKAVPHNVALGLEPLLFEAGHARIRLPYRAELAGNPDTGVLHGGVLTAFMDACCGAAVFMKVLEAVKIATLDLRIDYLRPALAGRDLICNAECYRLTHHVAFVRGVAHHDSADEPIAMAAGTFMVERPELLARATTGQEAL